MTLESTESTELAQEFFDDLERASKDYLTAHKDYLLKQVQLAKLKTLNDAAAKREIPKLTREIAADKKI